MGACRLFSPQRIERALSLPQRLNAFSLPAADVSESAHGASEMHSALIVSVDHHLTLEQSTAPGCDHCIVTCGCERLRDPRSMSKGCPRSSIIRVIVLRERLTHERPAHRPR